MKTRGWFHIAAVFLTLGFSSQLVALNLDFEKEIKKREIVTVRVVERLNVPQAPSDDTHCQKERPPQEGMTESSEDSFSVCLSSIRH